MDRENIKLKLLEKIKKQLSINPEIYRNRSFEIAGLNNITVNGIITQEEFNILNEQGRSKIYSLVKELIQFWVNAGVMYYGLPDNSNNTID